MDKRLSVYLDLMRFLAAMWVVLAHLSNFDLIDGNTFWWLPESGRDAVVIFFVLSGFVIAFTTQSKNRGVFDYISARAARIYSVALPALILTVGLDLWGIQQSPEHYLLYQYEKLWLYVPFHLAFAGELWFLSEQPFTIGPYWSLGYEVWYYVLFGTYFFSKGWTRWVLVSLVLALVGFKLWLLLPIWVAGVVLYHNLDRIHLSKAVARWLFWGSLLGYLVYSFSELKVFLEHFPAELLGSYENSVLGSAKKVLSDYIVCLFFLTNIAAFRFTAYDLQKHAKWIRYLADHTFVLYLVHAPLMHNLAYHTNLDPNSWLTFALSLGGVLAFSWAFAFVSEYQKGNYKRLFQWIFSKFTGRHAAKSTV